MTRCYFILSNRNSIKNFFHSFHFVYILIERNTFAVFAIVCKNCHIRHQVPFITIFIILENNELKFLAEFRWDGRMLSDVLPSTWVWWKRSYFCGFKGIFNPSPRTPLLPPPNFSPTPPKSCHLAIKLIKQIPIGDEESNLLEKTNSLTQNTPTNESSKSEMTSNK